MGSCRGLVSLISLFFVFIIAPSLISAQRGNVDIGGQRYYISEEKATWDNARKYCQGIGQDLIAIQDEAELNRIIAHLNKLHKFWFIQRSWDYWLGSKNGLTSPNIFTWTATGQPFIYSKWLKNEPSRGSAKRLEGCVMMHNHASSSQCNTKPCEGSWVTVPCTEKFQYICKNIPQGSHSFGSSHSIIVGSNQGQIDSGTDQGQIDSVFGTDQDKFNQNNAGTNQGQIDSGSGTDQDKFGQINSGTNQGQIDSGSGTDQDKFNQNNAGANQGQIDSGFITDQDKSGQVNQINSGNQGQIESVFGTNQGKITPGSHANQGRVTPGIDQGTITNVDVDFEVVRNEKLSITTPRNQQPEFGAGNNYDTKNTKNRRRPIL